MLRGLQLHMISLFLHRQYGIVVANIMLGDMKSRWSWTGLFVCTLKKPVSYEGKKTSVLFMIGLRNRADRKLMVFYKLIGLLLSHPMGLREVIRSQSYDVLMEWFQRIPFIGIRR